jgi:hypothetical protein
MIKIYINLEEILFSFKKNQPNQNGCHVIFHLSGFFYFNKINESFRLDLVYVYFMPKQLYLRVLYI